jgi:hypothetical protein
MLQEFDTLIGMSPEEILIESPCNMATSFIEVDS